MNEDDMTYWMYVIFILAHVVSIIIIFIIEMYRII